MTRDEIMQLTAEELRMEIAKAKGWQIYHYDKDIAENCYYLLVDSDFDAVNPFNYRKTEAECWEKDLPGWPANIADAWELVEEMGKLENVTIQNVEDYWRCEVDDMARTIGACATTAPIAICKAYLRWKSEK
jgi:hypothetical protein